MIGVRLHANGLHISILKITGQYLMNGDIYHYEIRKICLVGKEMYCQHIDIRHQSISNNAQKYD